MDIKGVGYYDYSDDDDGYEEIHTAVSNQTPVSNTTVSASTQQSTQPQKKPQLEHDFYKKPLDHIKQMDSAFRIHLGIAIVVSGLCFLLWRLLTPTAMWWWVYPTFGFAISVSIHRYAPTNKVKAGIVVVGLINLMLFFTNFIVMVQHTAFPWFIYPCYATLAIGMFIYYRSDTETHTGLKLATHEYLLLNVMLFITWVLTKGFPWFIYPFFVLGLPIVIVYVIQVYEEHRPWVFAGIASLDIAIITFLTWGFSGGSFFPWFLFVWGPLALITGLMWYFKRDENYTDLHPAKFADEEMPEPHAEQSSDYNDNSLDNSGDYPQSLYPNLKQ